LVNRPGMKYLILIVWLLALEAEGALAPRVKVIHDAREGRLARTLADQAEEALIGLEKEFDLRFQGRITVVLAASAEEFAQVQPEGARVPSWAAGVAYPEQNLIILKTPRLLPGMDLKEVLLHEIVHVILGQKFGARPIPTWLNEGLTMHLAGEWGWSRQIAMARAVASNRLIPLDRLVKGFPENRLEAETAYAQSYYFVAFLRDRYGPAVLGRLIQNLGLGISPPNALLQATGLRASDLTDEFAHWLSRRFSIFWYLTGPSAVWFLAGLLILAAWLVRKRSAARKMAEWEAEENGPGIDSGRPRGTGRTDRA